jgi:hypothetical protein
VADISRAETADQAQVKRSLMLALGGASVIVVGSLLPWLTVTTDAGVFSFRGTEGNASITMALGFGIALLAGAALFQKRATLFTGLLTAVAGVVAGLEAVNFVSDAQTTLQSESLQIMSTMEFGIWVALLGCVVSVVAGVYVIVAVLGERRGAAT